MIYCLTIQKSNKRYTTFPELRENLMNFCKRMKVNLIDYGFHIVGKLANYAHIHALVQSGVPVHGKYHQEGPFNFAWQPLRDREAYDQYMHSQDYNRVPQVENLEVENYYMHNYAIVPP